MASEKDSRPSLPANSAFVVQLGTSQPGASIFSHGRVEHVVSGRATHFSSWEELQAFIEEVLAETKEKPP